MDVTRKTDYALRMVADLVREPDRVLSVRAASEANDIPYSFARSIQQSLIRSGLVESVRGSRGGMRLAVDPDETTLRTVVEAVQGEIAVSRCDESGRDGGPCPRMGECPFNPVWCASARMLADYYDSMTIADVVAGRIPDARP